MTWENRQIWAIVTRSAQLFHTHAVMHAHRGESDTSIQSNAGNKIVYIINAAYVVFGSSRMVEPLTQHHLVVNWWSTWFGDRIIGVETARSWSLQIVDLNSLDLCVWAVRSIGVYT